jgi:hypothetical protein
MTSKHLSYIAALGIVVYALMQMKEEHDWSRMPRSGGAM